MKLQNPQAIAGSDQSRSAGLGPQNHAPLNTVFQQSRSRNRLVRWVYSLALLAITPVSYAQSGTVVIQIRVTAPTCAVSAGQTNNPSALPIQLDPRCPVAPLIEQVPAPTKTAAGTGNTVIQISYQ